MNEEIVLLNRELLGPILIGALLLWTLMLWKEWPQRREFRGRIKVLASLLATAALALLALRPALPAKSAVGKGILISQGHRPGQLDSLRSRLGRLPVETYVQGQPLVALENVDSLFVLGLGPEVFDRWLLKGKAINFLGAPMPSGLVDIAHRQKIYLGEALKVRAEFQDPGPGLRAFLLDPGGNTLDSIALEAGGRRYFELGAHPKAEGRFVHFLEVRGPQGNQVAREPIPVEVLGKRALDILVLERFPSFEGKYLKNFLADRGHRLTVCSQLSRDRYRYEGINGGRARFTGFSAQGLADYDLILMDTGTYLGLGQAHRKALETALKENPSGLLILPEESLFTAVRTPFRFERAASVPFHPGQGSPALEKYSYGFVQGFPLQPIAVDGAILAAYRPLERGRVATTLLRNSYQLVLKGEGERYADLWTAILDATVPDKGAWAQWEDLAPLPRVDAPYGFRLRTAREEPLVNSGEGSAIPLIQDPALPTLWQGRFYPKRAGWNRLEILGDSLYGHTFYVYAPEQRKAMGQAARLEANVRLYPGPGTFGPLGEPRVKRPLPLSPLWAFLPWLLAMGWLWLEPRLRGG